MTSSADIRNKIISIKSTQKITAAMQTVAVSKMRKAQQRMQGSMPYSDKIHQVIGHVANAHSQFNHPYLRHADQVARAGFIIIATDRGLCGALNLNLFKQILLHMQELSKHEVQIDLCIIGLKAYHFFKRYPCNILAHANNLGGLATLNDIIGVVKVILDAYDRGAVQQIYVAHNEFVNTMIQRPKIVPLLPLASGSTAEREHYWDYIYEPDVKTLLDTLLVRYVESQVFQAVLDNDACEQAARMLAMQNATDNANELINELQLSYNKARQAAITREIADIIGGAEAIN